MKLQRKKQSYKRMLSIFKKKQKSSIRYVAVEAMYSIVEEYSDWYEKHGLYLPPDYATDPTAWTIALHKMKRAFNLLKGEHECEGELWDVKNEWKTFEEMDVDKLNELNKEVAEGLTLFGSQLLYMTDIIIDK